MRDDELPALYATYYPPARIDAADLASQAVDASSAWTRGRLWWNGRDNKGHLLARPGERVLDYGCGSGVSLLEVRKLGAEGYGVEADPNVQEAAGLHGLDIHIGSLKDDPFPGIGFHLVSLNQVLEHIPDPAQLLTGLSRRIVPGGRIVLSSPNVASLYRRSCGVRWINWHVPYHQHHFTKRSLRLLAAKAGWRVVRLRTVTPTPWTILQIRARHRPPRGRPNPLWTAQVRASEPDQGVDAPTVIPAWMRAAYYLGLPFVNAWNRLIDAVGLGDSLVAELRREPLTAPPEGDGQ